MMYQLQQRALLPGDPSAFKRRRLSSLSDGNKGAVLTLLSFKGGVPDSPDNHMTSPGHDGANGYQHHSPPIRTINASDQLRGGGGGGGQSYSSTSTYCSSVTYGTIDEAAEGTKTEVLGENGGIRLNPPPVPAPRSTGISSPPSLLNMAMAQPPSLPLAQAERRDHPRAAECAAVQLPEGRPLSAPPKLPPPPPPSTAPYHNHHPHYFTKKK